MHDCEIDGCWVFCCEGITGGGLADLQFEARSYLCSEPKAAKAYAAAEWPCNTEPRVFQSLGG